MIAFYVALPVLGTTLAVGLLAATIQAATRQTDPTVSTVPRLLAAGGATAAAVLTSSDEPTGPFDFNVDFSTSQ